MNHCPAWTVNKQGDRMVRKRKQEQEEEGDDSTMIDASIESLIQSARRVTSRVWNPDPDLVEDDTTEDPERNSEYYAATERQFCIGQLLGVDHNVGEHESTMLRFVDPHGNEFATWQRGTLKTQVTEAHYGKYIMIVFKGLEPSKRKGRDDMHLFDVYILNQAQFDTFGKKNKVLPF